MSPTQPHTTPAEPSPAERARTIVASAREAALSTLAVDPAGTPFGSLVEFALDERGRPVMSLSDLAEHSRNLAADPRASVMVVEPEDASGGLARGRVTLLGTCERVTSDEREGARALYMGAHPHAFYADFADFNFYRLDVAQVRWVGGFGAMNWLETEAYAAAEPDPLAGDLARSAIDHMRDDHADALLAMAQHLGGAADATDARVTKIDRYGFDAVAVTAEGPKNLRLPFGEDVTTAEALRAAMVRLTREARAAAQV